MDITGTVQFKNLPNALTNLDGDVNKRIECEAIGYPLPSLKWRFQAIDEEVTYLSVSYLSVSIHKILECYVYHKS